MGTSKVHPEPGANATTCEVGAAETQEEGQGKAQDNEEEETAAAEQEEEEEGGGRVVRFLRHASSQARERVAAVGREVRQRCATSQRNIGRVVRLVSISGGGVQTARNRCVSIVQRSFDLRAAGLPSADGRAAAYATQWHNETPCHEPLHTHAHVASHARAAKVT